LSPVALAALDWQRSVFAFGQLSLLTVAQLRNRPGAVLKNYGLVKILLWNCSD
jgi:hypothetical protein